MRFLTYIVSITLLVSSIYAEQKESVKELLESKVQADMSYQEMMQIMGMNAQKIHQGILLQNPIMVRDAAQAIQYHKAPNHKPWLIMPKPQQEGFKEMLLVYDELLHEGAEDIADAVEKNDWSAANRAFGAMSESCIVCHGVWRNQVIKRNFKVKNQEK